MPPKKRVHRTALPKQDRDICARLRSVRDYLNFSQGAFAFQVGITREALASYEDARAPLRTAIALRICRQFIVSEKWLALGFVFPTDQNKKLSFGSFRSRLCMDLLNSAAITQETARIPFASAFCGDLAAQYELFLKEASWMPRIVLSPNDGVEIIKNALFFCQDHWLHMLDDEKRRRFAAGLIRAARILFYELNARISPGLGEFENQLLKTDTAGKAWSKPIKLLTEITSSGNTPDVKAQWPLLKQRLQKATEATGKKSRLSEFLGVKLSNVSQWLTDHKSAREPGAETALRMLKWLEHQERK